MRALLIDRGLILDPAAHATQHSEPETTKAHPAPAAQKYNSNSNRHPTTKPHQETCAQEKEKLQQQVHELKAEISTLHAQLAPYTTTPNTTLSAQLNDTSLATAETNNTVFSSQDKHKVLQ